MDCPSCQEPVAEGTRFCPSCGHAVQGDPDGTAVLASVGAGEADATGETAGPDTAAATPTSTELRSCPACGADNSAGRVLCARCGVDLDSGERPVAAPVVHRPGPAEDVAGDVSEPDTGRGNRTAAIVAAIVVVGAAVGVLVGLWLAGSGDEPEQAAPTFDPGVYTGEPEALEVTAVGASSSRPPSGEASYGADNLVDDDITTAWSHDPAVESAQDVDLALELSDPAWVTALTFANGAQTDDLAFAADGRVLRLTLLVGGSAAAELHLLDEPGLQRVTLPEPVLVDTIRLVVLEAVPGDTYDEVSLSEIVVTGHPARGEDLARMVADADVEAEAE